MTHKRKFTASQIISMRETYDKKLLSIKSLAEFYDVNWKSMRQIVNGHSYKDVPFKGDTPEVTRPGRTASPDVIIKMLNDRRDGFTVKAIAQRNNVAVNTVYRNLKRFG